MNSRKANALVAILVALGVVEAGCAASSGDNQALGSSPLVGVTINDGKDAQTAVNEADQPLQSTKGVEVDPREFRQLLFQDAIPPIYQPEFTSAGDADLDPEELVIGVEINGDARAYPIGPLVRREMVNDVVGGTPILVTW